MKHEASCNLISSFGRPKRTGKPGSCRGPGRILICIIKSFVGEARAHEGWITVGNNGLIVKIPRVSLFPFLPLPSRHLSQKGSRSMFTFLSTVFPISISTRDRRDNNPKQSQKAVMCTRSRREEPGSRLHDENSHDLAVDMTKGNRIGFGCLGGEDEAGNRRQKP